MVTMRMMMLHIFRGCNTLFIKHRHRQHLINIFIIIIIGVVVVAECEYEYSYTTFDSDKLTPTM